MSFLYPLMKIKTKILHNSMMRNGMLFSFFSFLNSGISFIITIVMASFILPSSYGDLNLFNTIVSLLAIFISLNTTGMLGVNFFRVGKHELNGYVNVMFLTTLTVGIIMSISVVFFNKEFTKVIGLSNKFQLYAILICMLQVLSNNTLDIWRLEEKVIKYGVFTSLYVLSNLLLTLLFVGFLKWDWVGRVYAQLFTAIIFAILGLAILIYKGYASFIKPNKAQIIDSYKFGLPLIPHSISFWFRQGLDRYIIFNNINNSAVGIFSFAYNFANMMQIIGYAFNQSNSVNIYKILSGKKEGGIKQLNKECKFLVLFYICLAIIVSFASVLLIPILFPKYSESIIYVVPLIIGGLGQCLYLTYVNILFYYKKTTVLMYITFVVSLLHCVASVLLTCHGLIYTSCISMASNLLIFIFVYIYAKKVIRINFK